ncbi:hypothetical protein D7X33_08050 [Butyricicoccus sp. 1XD8-22]|nr:hypothetical protein D7X33_08050 [Butyricicoccus sp. 1XD8-22]
MKASASASAERRTRQGAALHPPRALPSGTRQGAALHPPRALPSGTRQGAALHPPRALPSGTRQGAALHPPRALPSGTRQGAALHPLGLSPQTPRCFASPFACGRDGGSGCLPTLYAASRPSPPERRRAGAGLVKGWVLSHLALRRTKSRWHNDASGFSLLLSGFMACSAQQG